MESKKIHMQWMKKSDKGAKEEDAVCSIRGNRIVLRCFCIVVNAVQQKKKEALLHTQSERRVVDDSAQLRRYVQWRW